MSVKASAAELLLVLLPLLATASEEGVYPRPLATAAIQRQASSGSCPAVDSPRFWGHHVGVVEEDDGVLQSVVILVLQNREDFVAILFYASWCPFLKIFRTGFQKLSSSFQQSLTFLLKNHVSNQDMEFVPSLRLSS